MAINPNNGVLDIINGTLKVSSIDIKQTAGFTTAINTVARNDVLLADDQKSTTTFTPTALNGYMSSTGVTPSHWISVTCATRRFKPRFQTQRSGSITSWKLAFDTGPIPFTNVKWKSISPKVRCPLVPPRRR